MGRRSRLGRHLHSHKLYREGFACNYQFGYGLAKGKGWQFFIIGSVLHIAVNFLVLPYRKGSFTFNQVEIYLAGATALITLVVLWLRWGQKYDDEIMTPIIPLPPPEPEPPVEKPETQS
jgi:hypothetical protein